jgi:hypothetical protein
MSLPKIYDWEKIRAALKLLGEEFPAEFPTWVLIGGGACWFYRVTLEAANDPDFRMPPVRAEDEIHWLSKDVDFMGLTEAEAAALLQSSFKPESHTISYRGLEVDFLEEGFRLTRDLAVANSREVRASGFDFLVINPAILYAEKCALIANKARPQDWLHHALLVEFLKFEFCVDLEAPATLDVRDWLNDTRTVKTADHDFFTRDPKLVARLQRNIRSLTSHEHRAFKHWAKHHLPGYTE